MIHRVTYNDGAQTLYHVPTDRQGRERYVASATYVIADLLYPEGSSSRQIATGTADPAATPSTTLSAASGPATGQPSRLNLASAASFAVDRRYWIEAVSGHGEVVRASAVDTTNERVEAAQDLSRDYSTSDTVRAVELQATFPAAVADDDSRTLDDDGGRFQVVWTYTLDGVVHNVREPIRVYRYRPSLWARREDVIARHSSLTRYPAEDFEAALKSSQEDVEAHLAAAGVKDVAALDAGSNGRVIVAYMAAARLLRTSGSDRDQELARDFVEMAKGVLHNLTTRRPPADVEQVSLVDDAITAVRATSGWVRG